MSKFKATKVYILNDFVNWFNNGELELSPKYQRNSVWNAQAKSYLIDTILRGLPVPQIFMRQIVDVKTKKTKREIIDGQQRLRTILDFVSDSLSLSPSCSSEYGGSTFSDLPDDLQEEFLEYELPVEIIKTKEDSVIYDMFARVNTNNMTLNRQELRNAKFWGEFKVFAYSKALEYRDFFMEVGMFKDRQLSRMIDVEYISSLIIGLIDGVVTDTPKTIDKYYERFDENFEIQELIEYKLDRLFELAEKLFFYYTQIEFRYFHRKSYFYTLFMALNHMLFGVDNIDIDRTINFSDENINENIDLLLMRLDKFESDYDRYMNSMIYDNEDIIKLNIFEKNHRTRTTNSSERKDRIIILLESMI